MSPFHGAKVNLKLIPTEHSPVQKYRRNAVGLPTPSSVCFFTGLRKSITYIGESSSSKMSRAEKLTIVVFYHFFPDKVIFTLFKLSKNLTVTEDSCLTGSLLGFLSWAFPSFKTISAITK